MSAPRALLRIPLAAVLTLLLAGAASAEEEDDGAVTVLGTGPLRKSEAVVRGAIGRVTSHGLGVEVATFEVKEVLRGKASASVPIRLISNEPGYLARIPADAVLFLAATEGGSRSRVVASVGLLGEEGPARLAAVRRSLAIEALPAEERPAALRRACFEGLGAPDAWTRQNAGREVAHLAASLPGAFTEGDLRDLRRRASREGDRVLRPLLVEAAESLGAAAARGALSPSSSGDRISLRGAPALRALREGKEAKERAAAAEALGREGGAEAGSALLEAARRDPDSTVRAAAVEALGFAGAAAAIPELRSLAGTEPALARVALFALARIGTPEATAALREFRAALDPKARPDADTLRSLVDFLLSEDFRRQEDALRKLRD